MSVARRHRRLLAVVVVVATSALSGCGGGGETTTAGGARGGAVPNSQLAEKIGLVSNGAGEYRLGGCTAKALLTSPAAIERAKKDGKKIVTDPTGRYAIEVEDPARCAQVMEEAVAILNVP
jgi:hypothetical protein